MLSFRLITPTKIVYEDQVDMVVLPGERGHFGVLPDHAPLMSSLVAGAIDIYKEEKIIHRFFASHGVVHVTPEGCQVLAEEAIFIEALNGLDLPQMIEKLQNEIGESHSLEDQERLKRDLKIAFAKQQIMNELKPRDQ